MKLNDLMKLESTLFKLYRIISNLFNKHTLVMNSKFVANSSIYFIHRHMIAGSLV